MQHLELQYEIMGVTTDQLTSVKALFARRLSKAKRKSRHFKARAKRMMEMEFAKKREEGREEKFLERLRRC